MILSELMTRLDVMFPRYGLDGWRSEYKRVLGGIPGDALERGFNAAMDGWKKSTPPKPADILENVPASVGSQKLRPAGTENEARAWTETHPYMRGTFAADWRHVLVGQDFSGSMAAIPWAPPTDEDRSNVAELVREALHKAPAVEQ